MFILTKKNKVNNAITIPPTINPNITKKAKLISVSNPIINKKGDKTNISGSVNELSLLFFPLSFWGVGPKEVNISKTNAIISNIAI